MIFVLFGPGGAGKGTIADPGWSPPTRASGSAARGPPGPRRPGEPDDAYVFVDRATFEARIGAGGFFEWAEFLGNLYGTPVPDPGPGRDVLLEIDLQGAQQVRRLRPDATLILLLPPSPEAQEERLRARGDDEAHVAQRLQAGPDEEREGRAIADAVVVNRRRSRRPRPMWPVYWSVTVGRLTGAAPRTSRHASSRAGPQPRPTPPTPPTEGS